MKTDRQNIKIDKDKKNAVIIGDCFDLIDILEIYLYQRFNVICSIDEFDGMEKIGHYEPSIIFIKSASNINTAMSFAHKLMSRNKRDIPIIVYSKEEISSIADFNLKAAGVREVIKFPIEYKDFWTILSLCIKL